MIYIHWIYLLLYMAIMIPAIITVLMDNRQPAKTMAWILVLAFMPFVGIIFYNTRSHCLRKSLLGILSHYFPILCSSQQTECQEDGQDTTTQHR